MVRYVPNPVKTFLWVTVFSFGIAILVWSTSESDEFFANLVVSLCIGWSISLSFILLERPIQRLFNPYFGAVVLTLGGLAFGLFLAGTVILKDPLYFFRRDFSTLLVGIFFAVVGLALFGTRGRLQQTAAELAAAKLQTTEQQKAILETELKLLQAQIEPHFLFNTLTNIAGLIHTKPDQAEQTLLNLTTFLRASLSRTRSSEASVAQEIEIVQAYLDIQTIRMQDRLTFELHVDPSLRNHPLPPLLLQPLVENAVKHGLDPVEQGGHLDVYVQQNNEQIEIRVCDNGAGFSDKSPNAGSGTGLANVRHRLQGLYGAQSQLVIRDNKDKGTQATLTIPLRREFVC